MLHKKIFVTLGLLITLPCLVFATTKKVMIANTADPQFKVTYFFDKAHPITVTIPGHETATVEIPSDARVVSLVILTPTDAKEDVYSVTDDQSLNNILNSNMIIVKKKIIHLIGHRFDLITEESIRDDQARKEHLKQLPGAVYNKVVDFFKNLGKKIKS